MCQLHGLPAQLQSGSGTRKLIDLNSDLGEGAGEAVDESLLDLVTSANIACGGHAGDEQSMKIVVSAARSRGVRIGAHPSYPDPANFGRVSVSMAPEQIAASVVGQVERLIEIASQRGAEVSYIKPHGALYNDAAEDTSIGEAVLAAATRLSLPLMVLAGSALARRAGASAIEEGFIDRSYASDGTLVPRTQEAALIIDPATAGEQAVRLASSVDSLCVHSDTPGALELLKAARAALGEAGFEISSASR